MRTALALAASLTALALACRPGTAACEGDRDCSGGAECVADPAAGHDVCAAPCAADLPCGAGFACVAAKGRLEGVCLDVRDDRALGSACTEDRECGSGACAGDADALRCAATCTLERGCEDEGTRCTLDGLRFVCVAPLDDRAVGEACSSARECSSGLCVLPPGREQAVCAAGCEGPADCGADVCLRLERGGSACVEALPDGAACTSHELCAGGLCVEDRDAEAKCASPCSAGACAPDFFCVQDDEGQDVCMPRLDSRAAGEACAVDRECQSGLCRRFVADTDLGTLCADPCAPSEPVCADGLVCWDGDDVDVCGPAP